uniref:Uncharacterized protein n=1 Tax=Chloropicon laureae TaxID=464258 RepID=A0A7S3E2J0_9CHLO|mmetsp:Transcript_3816/g.9649  ORF Transcript_3816/g.9649 Transcript_3816/m.9649 type:complete len:189 (+) Transcript_3816:2-568(+)
MEALPKEQKKDLAQAIMKLQQGEELSEAELAAVRKLLKRARGLMYARAHRKILSELKQLRRDKFAVGANMRMMRRELKDMRRTFKTGKATRGYGNMEMFVPGTGLMNGAKQDVDIDIKEIGDRRMKMRVTFPWCGDVCIWDPVIEMTEDTSIVPNAPGSNSNARDATTTFAATVFGVLVSTICLLSLL